MKTFSATFVTEVTVIDPDTKNEVKVSIYKHDQSEGMFGVDSSFIEQNFDDEETATIADPFNNDAIVELESDSPKPYDENVDGDEWTNWK